MSKFPQSTILVARITCTPMSGNGDSIVQLSIESTELADMERQAIIRLQSATEDWAYSIPITINQAGAAPSIDLPYLYINAPATGLTDSTIPIQANCSWTVSSHATWIRAAKKQSSIVVSIDANSINDIRQASITVSYKNLTRTIQVFQAPTPASF